MKQTPVLRLQSSATVTGTPLPLPLPFPVARFRGFTLVEMMVTLAIVGLLTVTALRAVTQAARAGRRQERAASVMGRGEAVWDLLRQDLVHAQRLRRTKDAFEIQGAVRLEPGTGEHRHLPATAVYRACDIRGRRVLLREQRIERQGPTAELVSLAVLSLAVTGKDGKELPLEKWQSVPDDVTVKVVFEESGETTWTVHRK